MKAQREQLTRVVVRFAGDSGDGMQLTGDQFANEVASAGSDLATLPDYPAEIRAPAGTLFGVSSFQIQFGSEEIYTPGDRADALVAMNPAALKVHLPSLKEGGLLVVNTGSFVKRNLAKAGYDTNPLDDPDLGERYRLIAFDISQLTRNTVAELGLSHKDAERCKNFFCLGIICWMYNRSIAATLEWIDSKFAKIPTIAEANKRALKAGEAFSETVELVGATFDVAPAEQAPGTYRRIAGNQALAYGLVAAARNADKVLVYGSYPITPATELLHELARLRHFRVRPFQAEDEISAMGAVVGAAFGGAIAVTGTSGPGFALKQEVLGLAAMTELPLVVINVQRGGPSTGLPTKTEQADLLQALFGRNGECPLIVLAPTTPGDCFTIGYEAVRLAVKYMTPVIVLSDGYLGNGSEPWAIPDLTALPPIVTHMRTDPEGFAPYSRDGATLARPWAVPGTPGLEHRLGGLEKEHITGNVSYDPDNHHNMIKLRAEKVQRVQAEIPPTEVFGDANGRVLVVGWGSTFGAIRAAVAEHLEHGSPVAAIHLRHLNPFPADLGELLRRFDSVLIPEINSGQLRQLLRAEFLVDAKGYNFVCGQPLTAHDVATAIGSQLAALEVTS